MSYQSNPAGRRAEHESYGDPPGAEAPGVNVGAPNSARGEGTSASELVARLRFLNCAACAFALAFHTLPTALRPLRLLSSPLRLILEVVAATATACLLAVEARVPYLGERAHAAAGRIALGGRRLMDLDAAGGRAVALLVAGIALASINCLDRGGSAQHGDEVGQGGASIASANATNVTNATVADDLLEDAPAGATTDRGAASGAFLVVLECALSSPTAAAVLAMAGYTLYIMHAFPEYARQRAYSMQDETAGERGWPAAEGPSWISNVSEYTPISGSYQTVEALR